MQAKHLFPLLTAVAIAQFPAQPKDTTLIPSSLYPDASVSYKQTNICETTTGVSAYAGYINLPASVLGPLQAIPYDLHTFFWYFSARDSPETAPLAIWISGGPGESALDGVAFENGPCYVNQDGSTVLNEYSLNNVANVLYIDQPSQTGFSYQTLLNGTLDVLAGGVVTPETTPEPGNWTALLGTFPDQDPLLSANNTDTAARILWHVVQTFVADFPAYDTVNQKISLFTNSYGGYFGPATFDFFLQQNAAIAALSDDAEEDSLDDTDEDDCELAPAVDAIDNGCLKDARVLELDTLGFTNGCVDFIAQALSYPEFAFHNTYNNPIIDQITYDEAIQNITAPGTGCYQLIQDCRAAALAGDPQNFGNNDTVNQACLAATLCLAPIILGDNNNIGGKDVFDISQNSPSARVPSWNAGWLNSREVQEALGVPLNWTADPIVTEIAFIYGTGDAARQDAGHLKRVLDAGVKVAMVFGDVDHRCNWIGAENVSLSVPYASSAEFNSAGYEPIVLPSGDIPGLVRQYNTFSFSRIAQAGHTAGYYAPEAVFEIFARTMAGTDVASGAVDLSESSYSTTGPGDSRDPSVQQYLNSTLPGSVPHLCNVWNIQPTCEDEQIMALATEEAVVVDNVVVIPAAMD